MTENQKLRKELQAAIVLFGHKCHDDCTKLTWLERAKLALAMQTAAPVVELHKQCPTCNWPLDAHDTDEPCKPKSAPAGERELPPLPDPTYIYHDAEQGEDDLFEFSESGAVDEGCPKCKRLYTADQMRAYALSALSAGDAVDGRHGVNPVAWLISVPNEPDLGSWLSEEPGAGYCKSEPLYATAAVQQYKEDAQRYRWLKRALFFGNVDIGEAYLTLRVVGSCPTVEIFDSAIDAAMRKGQL